MAPDEKGVFPSWMNEKDITNQLLNQILSRGGQVPYSFVINHEHDQATQERMRKILLQMEEEKLILLPSNELGNIELDVYGRQVSLDGYNKYKKKRRVNNRLTVIFFRLILIGGCAGFLYLLFHYFKII